MNPEFQRNLYLEFSVARLIGMPLFLALIFAFSYLIGQDTYEGIAHAAMTLYIFIVVLWGARQTAESLFDEIRNHTWDIQKTSAISAWSLAWGKLLGSTIFNWYGGFLCLIAYTLTTPDPHLGLVWLYALGMGLFAQSLSFLISLLLLRCKQTNFSILNLGMVFFALMYFFPLLFGEFYMESETIEWYGIPIAGNTFIALNLWLVCAWSIIGVYRLLAEALQIRTLPWAWLGFIGFVVCYYNGYITNVGDHSFGVMEWAFMICFLLTYFALMADNNNPMTLRRLWLYSQQQQGMRILQTLPCWVVSLVILLIPCLYLTLFHVPEKIEKLIFHPIPLFLLLLRDIALILYFSYADNAKRALTLSLLYLTLLYWIIPAIFIELDSFLMAGIFLPLFTGNLGLAILFAGMQTTGMGFLLFQRWQTSVNRTS